MINASPDARNRKRIALDSPAENAILRPSSYATPLRGIAASRGLACPAERSLPMIRPFRPLIAIVALAGCQQPGPATDPFLYRSTIPPPGSAISAAPVVTPGPQPYYSGAPVGVGGASPCTPARRAFSRRPAHRRRFQSSLRCHSGIFPAAADSTFHKAQMVRRRAAFAMRTSMSRLMVPIRR